AAWEGAGGGGAARRGHELVGRAVDDEGGSGDAAQLDGAVARGEDGRELARDRAGVVASVSHAAEEVSQVLAVALEAGGADDVEQRRGLGDVGRAVGGDGA